MHCTGLIIKLLNNMLLFSGLLITGGVNDYNDHETPYTAEVWLPGDRSCMLPRLPHPGRTSHTQSSFTACGGWETRTSCDTFDGEWEQSHSLSEGRLRHVSWQSPAGILLMGPYSSTITELLSTTTDTTTANFSLPYRT